MSITIPVAKVFAPFLEPARYKCAFGGRGSGKSHYFAGAIVEHCLLHPGAKVVCVREIQKTLAQSSKQVIEDKIKAFGVGDRFDVMHDRIRTPGGGVILFQGMQDMNAESIKSLEGMNLCWVEEAQTLSQRSLALLRPTIRTEGSEIFFSWNPRRKTDAVDEFLRVNQPDNAVVIQANWRDNPWWSETLEAERQLDRKRYPDRYPNIWEGEYARALEGAYFSSVLTEARAQKRIGKIAADPLLSMKAFWDIGGAGAKADANAIWIVQWVEQEIRVLDFIEGVGQTLGHYTNELRKRGYQNATCYLPHDGINTNVVTGKTYADHLKDAGFQAEPPVPNQGPGAAMMRIEAVRRLFPKCWFNEATTAAGLEALGYYHERRDEQRGAGLGPDHDWSSHAADAFGLMCCCYVEPATSAAFHRKLVYPRGYI